MIAKTPVKLVLTAGFDRSPAALALVELLRRDGHTVVGILVTAVLNPRRLRSLVRRSGAAFVRRALRRSLGLTALPGGSQEIASFMRDNQIFARSLWAWSREHEVRYLCVPDLNAPKATQFVRECAPDVVLYAGGGILRSAFLDAAGGKVLNAHAGPLPAIRGMNACEWAILLGHEPVVTVHAIDPGIDTGQIFSVLPVPVRAEDTLSDLRERCVVRGIVGLREKIPLLLKGWGCHPQQQPTSRQCFVMAPALLELAASKLDSIRSRV